MSGIVGTCSACGFVFAIEKDLQCPVCCKAERSARVAKAFSPVDPLRTALGIGGKRPKTAEEWKVLRDEYVWESIRMGSRFTGSRALAEEGSEIPEGCKMPKDEAGQVWELRRMFRL